MKTLQQIKADEKNAVNKLFNDCGVFWAFSNQQFEENKTPLKEGDKYVSINNGGYMPKSNVDKYINGMKAINKDFKKQMKDSKELRRQHIAYELANHEAYYTGEITDTLTALGSGYTAKEVWKVWREENKKNAEAGFYN